jgi:type II secretory ATPase GspE/PulE/Tfp pilus assembly ATPase PilB-like protein
MNTDEMRELAVKHGMLTLKNYGVMLLKEGFTTVDEILQCVVVQGEE